MHHYCKVQILKRIIIANVTALDQLCPTAANAHAEFYHSLSGISVIVNDSGL